MSLNRKNAIASAKYAAISLLMLFFIACDDSTSAASSDPVAEISSSTVTSAGASAGSSSVTSAGSVTSPSSSSSVEKSKYSSSSVIPASSGDLQSSSSKGSKNSSSSEDKAKESSSSVKPTSSSDAKSSSSSVTSAGSVTSSSSSVAVSSSSFDINAPCTYADVHIEEVNGERLVYTCYEDGWKRYIPKSSSSSVAKSSSSSSQVYKHLDSPLYSVLSYGEFTDPRDGTKYATIDIDNKYGPDSTHIAFTVFAQNLKYHEKMVLGANEQDDDTKVEMYCYHDSIEYCNDWWGGLYQWAEMLALPYECNSKSCANLIGAGNPKGFHRGICPEGWHVINGKEMKAAFYVTGEDDNEKRYAALRAENSFSYGGGWYANNTGMSFIATGFRSGRLNGFKGYREDSYSWIAEERQQDIFSGNMLGLDEYPAFSGMKKIDGLSVRCVKDY